MSTAALQRFLALASVLLFAAASAPAAAQAFPTKPIRMVVGFAGVSDELPSAWSRTR